MNKTKKLLSVVLAIVMALSCMSIMSSAAITQYKTVDDLKALDAYSPYGQVTRLSTEERASILQDFLDNVLPSLNINLGTVGLAGIIEVTIDLTSVDRLCVSLDSIKEVKSGFLFAIAAGIVNLGVLETLDMDSWNTGIDRAGDSPLTLFSELFELLSNNTDLVNEILTDGLDLGIIGGLIGGGLDLSSISDIVTDLPALVKGLIWGLFERWDDTLTEIKAYDTSAKGNGQVESTLNTFVQNLFNNDMSQTTLKYDANGTMTSEHTKWLANATGSAAPGTPSANSSRYYYQFTSTTPGSTMQSYHIVDEAEAKALAKDTDETNDAAAYTYVKENQIYVMTKEVEDSETCETYVWKAYEVDKDGAIVKDADGENKYLGTLKWYNDDSQFLKDFDGNSINLSTMSAGELLYTFIPTVFDNLATVVLNGSVKKILAEFFGAKFTYVGEGGPEADDAVLALPDASNSFFTAEKGEYVFNDQWSDYAVINGNHYYRFENQIFAADLSAKNNYFDIINWDYEITGDFMNEFIPASDDDASDRLLLHFNDFLVKVATTVTKASAETVDAISGFEKTWTRPTFASGNANVVANIKAAAQAVIGLAPQHIFGSDYATNDRCYYNLMMSSNNDTVLTGIAATLVDALMPSMTLPGKDEIEASGAKVGAILAAVVREFAAYLAPEYNFDALIYTSFENGTKTFVSGNGIDSNYWFDVILTMGINIGFEYLRAFADMGEGTTEWNSFVAYSGYGVDGKTYGTMTTAELNAHWEGMLDYVVDWALDKDYEWSWKMENLVNTSGLTVDMTSAEDPFKKIETILGSILPVSEILKVEPTNGESNFEHWLRYDLILGLVDLNWDHLINTIQFNGTNQYFRNANVLDQLAALLKGVVNSIFNKIGGGNYALIPSAITDFDSLASQSGIKSLATGLVGKLKTAYDNGLLVTALPLLGFFLGWKTDPQQLADPQIVTEFRNGNDYAYLYDNNKANQVQPGGAINGDGLNFTKIKITNNSSGMLETHRNSDVTDHAYDIQIKSVTSDAESNTLTFNYGDGYISPYETLEIIIDGTYNAEEAVTVTIAYEYLGKDGQPIGGTQYTTTTFLLSNQYEDTNVSGRKSGDDDEDYAGIADFSKYQFTEDIYGTITGYKPTINATSGTTGATGARDFGNIGPEGGTFKDCDVYQSGGTVPTGTAATYFEIQTTQAESGWPDQKPAEGAISGLIYKAKSGVTAETEFPYGVYDMGSCAVKYGSDSKVWEIDFIYYNSYGIYDVYTANKDNNYHAYQGVDPEIYNRYNEAWQLIVYGATYPMMTEANGHESTDYVKTIQPYIPDALEEFEAAKEAYEEALAEAQASGSSAALPSYITSLQEEIDNDFMNGKEINFQDYNFYEYFNYNDVKVAAENLYRTYLEPEVMDRYYILNSGIREAELNDVIAAESNATKAAAIAASRLENDQAAIDASLAAQDAWTMPITTKLVVEDMESRLGFYKQFLNTANMENNDHMYFLNKEIAFVEAQGLVEGDYEAVSWSRYADAYADAKAVAAGTDEFSEFNSRIYDVKYNLMVAYKQLLLKADSLIEAGGTAELLKNIAKAEAIFEMNIDDIVLSDIAIEKELTKEKALGHLIEGLGYYYIGEDGNEWNLYADSAYEYADNDRPNKQGNQAKVDAANANLEACLAYFVTAEAEPNTLVLNENAPFEAIIDRDNTIGGEYTGTVYGFDTLGYNDNWEVDGTIADFLSTAYGDDYLEVVVGDAGVETTGTVINVLDDNGDVVESYMFVYFGDMDMDGAVGLADSAMAEDYEMLFEGIDSLATFMAGDLDSDSMPGLSDSATMFDWEMLAEGMPLQADIGPNASGIVYEIF